MNRYEREIAAAMRGVRAACADAEASVRQWRTRVDGRLAEIDVPEPAIEVPADAPPEYHRVQARVDRGELEWLDVVTGRAGDQDAYVVHRWLSARLEKLADAVRALPAEAHR